VYTEIFVEIIMREYLEHFIDGKWTEPSNASYIDVTNPATEETVGRISLGSAEDVDLAVRSARTAFRSFSETRREDRLALLRRIVEVYQSRYDEFAEIITLEMGAPRTLASKSQAACGTGHFQKTIEILENYEFEEVRGATVIRREPIGVCGLITPWNWPINQIACKVAPALAMGCTVVLKPSEVAPLSACLLADVLCEANVPAGVFNLVNGDGTGVGAAISAHRDVDMVSFTGSTRAGVAVAKAAADSVKRVTQELGGKSAYIILDDADLEGAVTRGVESCMRNSGQSCNAPTRMLVPKDKLDKATAVAKKVAEGLVVNDPQNENTNLGPVVSKVQYDRIQALIEAGINEGAELVCGGRGRPDGISTGYFVRPTVFTNVSNIMRIACEEVFGPVLSILPYASEEEAIHIANDTPYGLSGYVESSTVEHAEAVAQQLRTGMVHLNGSGGDFGAPFGGYKQSGNGREWGPEGFEEFVETKAIMGARPA
jgi:aldehyde dehydrogenase (NAD+)